MIHFGESVRSSLVGINCNIEMVGFSLFIVCPCFAVYVVCTAITWCGV